jgi:hypothetical protein
MATACKRCAIHREHRDPNSASNSLVGLLPKDHRPNFRGSRIRFPSLGHRVNTGDHPAPHSSVAVRIEKRCDKARTHGTME